jgi:choline dehydrogenase-like flavoprotein
LASRLSEKHKVLLLEAGGGLNPFQAIPAMSLLMLNYPQIDWKHKTVPQKNCCFALPHNVSEALFGFTKTKVTQCCPNSTCYLVLNTGISLVPRKGFGWDEQS